MSKPPTSPLATPPSLAWRPAMAVSLLACRSMDRYMEDRWLTPMSDMERVRILGFGAPEATSSLLCLAWGKGAALWR